MKSKSQSIHQIRAIATHQSSSLNKKRMKLMKGICYNLMMSWFQTWGYERSRLIPKSLRSLLLKMFFLTLMRLKKSQKRMITILITIKSPSLWNSKLLLDKIIQVICLIFWTSLHSTESHHRWSKAENLRLGKQA